LCACYVTFNVVRRYGWRGFFWLVVLPLGLVAQVLALELAGDDALGRVLGRTVHRSISISILCTGLCLWLTDRYKSKNDAETR
jgi:hypothetical protein